MNELEFLRELREAVSESDGLGCYSYHENCAIGVLLRKQGYSEIQLRELSSWFVTLRLMNEILGLPDDSTLFVRITDANDDENSYEDKSWAAAEARRGERRDRMIKWIDKEISEVESEHGVY